VGNPDRSRRAEAVIDAVYGGPLPHVRLLDITVEDFGEGIAVLRLPWQEKLVGNPETGVLHGGAVTTLIDTTCGLAVLAAMATPDHIATLDLRIDYLKPAAPGKVLTARADCYRTTRRIAFVRASAYHNDPGDAVASAHGTFMFTGAHGGGRRANRRGGGK